MKLGFHSEGTRMNVDLTNPIFHDETEARGWLERSRWGLVPACAHCGSERVTRMQGEAHRAGLFTCKDCNKQFSVTVGTVMERSHIPLPKWVLAFHLLSASKKGMSSLQLSRMLHIGYKSAWFMSHRIREAMTDVNPGPLGGEGKIVEADEAYHGKKETPTPSAQRKGRPYLKGGKQNEKRTIVALVERGGEARAFHVYGRVTADNVRDVLVRNADRKSRLHTDESRLYIKMGEEFAAHETVNHAAKEYARGDVTTNSVEGFFGIFKRGLNGNYQHCGEQHFQRYLNEFAFRYNNRIKLGVNDAQRAMIAARGADGKRLTYRRIGAA